MNTSAVVRIYCTAQRPDYDAPWQATTPRARTGSGVVIAPGRVLTGAHVVADATFLQVRKVVDPIRYTARLLAVCHDADLALLEVSEEAFAKDVDPAELGDLPALRQRVSVVGFPVGGQEVSVTEGIVSRIELQRYSHSWRQLLAITVDAAINSGNSGGPVFADGKVIGLAFQSHRDAENVGEVVPALLIRRFLDAVAAGRQVDVPSLSIRVQQLENPVLRKTLGLPEGASGVRVRRIEHGGTADGVLELDDVLLELDGRNVANNGTIGFEGFRTDHRALLGQHLIGDRIAMKVWRQGQAIELSAELRPLRVLAERHRYDVRPRYVVYAGLVFQPLCRDFLATWKNWWEKAPAEFLHHYYNGARRPQQRERVLVSQVLADELTVGYAGHSNELVDSVNGVAVQSLAHLAELLDASGDTVEVTTSWEGRLVFETASVRDREAEILDRYRIPAARSAVI